MSYLAFALKYRPKNFNEVIGQRHVVVSLRDAILQKRVAHAYLFSGPRGVGKTSLARIMAKSLNCVDGPTPDPCEKCLSCLEISKGKSLDIIEVDGASNRGIDDIRTLRENVNLSPAFSKYKIYIIDEVHQITPDGFNALLKTLEEPPAHVKFIFATTHPHKVPPTILSRCQKFQFSLVSLEEIVTKLKLIISSEKVKVEDSLLYTIGRAASGSIRDAESLLDQLVPVILEKGSLEDVFSFLGVVEEHSLNEMLEALINNDLVFCLDFIEKQAKAGKDLNVFLLSFIEHLRNLLLAKISINSFNDLSDISPESKKLLTKVVKKISINDILKIIDLLIAAKDISRTLNTVRIPLEIALVKYVHPLQAEPLSTAKAPKVKSVETPSTVSAEKPIIKQTEFQKNMPMNDTELDLEMKSIKFEDSAPEKIISDNKQTSVDTLDSDISKHNIEEDNLLFGLLKAKWSEVITRIQKTRAALSSHLSFAQPVSSLGNLVTITFSSSDAFHKEIVETPKNLDLIKEIISKVIGKPVGVKLTFSKLPQRVNPNIGSGKNKGYSSDSEKQSASEILSSDNDSFINELLDTFDGKFHSEE